jgi:hypothetical protein
MRGTGLDAALSPLALRLEAHAYPTTVFVDELYSSGFDRLLLLPTRLVGYAWAKSGF